MKKLFVLLMLAATAAFAQVQNGSPAPDFTLKDTTGKDQKLSDYKGKIVVLEWTNEECPFVVRHYGDTDTMIKLANANPDVVWLAIDSSSHRTPEILAAWIQKESIPYPVLSDQDGTVGKAYGAKTTPHMFIIAADGTVAYQGSIDNNPRGNKSNVVNNVEKALAELKAGKPVSEASTKPYGCSVKYK
jgi:peroxiredoxin